MSKFTPVSEDELQCVIEDNLVDVQKAIKILLEVAEVQEDWGLSVDEEIVSALRALMNEATSKQQQKFATLTRVKPRKG